MRLRRTFLRLLICISTALLAIEAPANTIATALPGKVIFDVYDNLRYIQEPKEPWSVRYILDNEHALDWRSPDATSPIGRTSDIYWFALDIRNTDEQPSHAVARLTQFRAHSLQAYLVSNGEVIHEYQGGLSTPLKGNFFATHNAIHITLGKDKRYQLLYRVDAQEYLFAKHFELKTPEQMDEDLFGVHIKIGAFSGIMFFIALCNLLAFVTLKDYLYLITSAWIFTITAHFMSYFASSIRYWVVDIPGLNSEILFFTYHSSAILSVIYPMLLLDTRNNSPKLHTLLLSVVAALIVLYFYLYDKPLGLSTGIVEIATIIMLPFLFSASFIAWKKKQAYSIYYMVALLILSSYFLAFIATAALRPKYIPTVTSMLLYVILSEMILISFAQIDRIRTLAKQAKSASARSLTDQLTGIPNRRAFDLQLKDAMTQCCESGEPLSCLIMDIDYFKKYNDSLGHVAGDECLIKVARAIATSLSRSEDSVARYGGEEFTIVLPGAGAESAQRVASTVLEVMHKLTIPHPQSPIAAHVTLSIGVVTTLVTDTTLASTVVETADQQLYTAKQNGRDCYKLTAKNIGS